MKATGVVRRIDDLGRVVIPKEIRKTLENSSPYAVPVYHKLGFVDTDTEQLSDGMRYTPMKFENN